MKRKIKILIVDDQPSQLIALEAAIADLAEVVRATSGRQALRHLLDQEFAVILLDVNMPDMDGFDTARLIRRRKSSEHTPIIFVTGYPDEIQVARGYSLGAVDYILTPVVPEILRTKVRVFVELYRRAAKIRRQAGRLRRRAAQLGALTSQLIQVEERERRRLAQILHDHIQQLLAAARLRLQLSRERQLDGGLSRILDEVEDLIAQSIEAARSLSVELHPPILEMDGLVPALQWLARHMQKSCGLAVHIEAEANPELSLPQRIFLFDATRELLLNVVKHSGTDQARIGLSGGPPDALRLAVEDRGMGFDRTRLDSVEATFEHSGLRTIRERLEVHGGGLVIESAPAKGTRIVLHVPTQAEWPTEGVPVASREIVGAPVSPSVPGPRSGRIRLLLADDHEIVRKGLLNLLQRQPDMEVIGEAGDGQTALELACRLSPDVVIMDLSMPRLNGIETTRRILAESPHVRVIGLSMDGGEDASAAMRRAGAVAHVPKGGPPEALIRAIRNARAILETGG